MMHLEHGMFKGMPKCICTEKLLKWHEITHFWPTRLASGSCNATPSPMYLDASLRPEPTTALLTQSSTRCTFYRNQILNTKLFLFYFWHGPSLQHGELSLSFTWCSSSHHHILAAHRCDATHSGWHLAYGHLHVFSADIPSWLDLPSPVPSHPGCRLILSGYAHWASSDSCEASGNICKDSSPASSSSALPLLIFSLSGALFSVMSYWVVIFSPSSMPSDLHSLPQLLEWEHRCLSVMHQEGLEPGHWDASVPPSLSSSKPPC